MIAIDASFLKHVAHANATHKTFIANPLSRHANAEHRLSPDRLPLGVVLVNGIVVLGPQQEACTTIAKTVVACNERSPIAPMWYEDWYVQRLSDVAKCWPTLHR